MPFDNTARRTPRKLRSLAGLAILALPMMMGAEDTDSGCGLIQDKLKSPVHGVTTLLEHADGTVVADLTLITTVDSDERWITGAEQAELRVPGGAIVPLRQTSDGHYTADSGQNPDLVYDGSGTNYRVTFELDSEKDADSAAGGEFIGVVEAPDDDVTFEISKMPEFAGDTATIEWTPSRFAGLLEIRNEAGERVYATFDWDHPKFDGSKWASLIHGGREDLRVDVFSDPGTYTVSFCAVQSQEGLDEELSSGLGILSGFLAGKCVEDTVVTVPE